jgi:hypothetical protein
MDGMKMDEGWREPGPRPAPGIRLAIQRIVFSAALVIEADPESKLETTSKDSRLLSRREFLIASPENNAGRRSVSGAYWFDCRYRVTRQFRIAAAGVMLPAVGLQTTKFTFPLVT